MLSGALQALPEASGDVVAGPGDDAAIIRQAGGGFQVISTDHLRGFVADPEVMARIAAVHALGDVWAMGAKPQVALASIILPQMSDALQARTLAEVTGALRKIVEGAGAQLVGGHTTMGAELTLGLTVTGLCEGPPLTVAGAKEGDALVLTRPIGSGVLLAADMAGEASGRDVAAALEVMQTPQGAAAEVLAGVAHAMTDVTGFGLAGHCRAICAASDLDAVLRCGAIPVYDGARALSEAGMSSSLMPANRVDAPVEGMEEPLLWDPQTAGGLLAAVPGNDVEAVLTRLSAAGVEGHLVGALQAGTGRITLS